MWYVGGTARPSAALTLVEFAQQLGLHATPHGPSESKRQTPIESGDGGGDDAFSSAPVVADSEAEGTGLWRQLLLRRLVNRSLCS